LHATHYDLPVRRPVKQSPSEQTSGPRGRVARELQPELQPWTLTRAASDPLDANHRRARGPDNPSSLQGLSMVVHASGCVSLLLYVLLYEVDVRAAQPDRVRAGAGTGQSE